MRLKSKTQKGSVLLAVVVVSMMMMVIVAAGISMVGHTQTRTNREYREKQAYFLASSSLKGFVSEVTQYGDGGTPADVTANITMLQNLASGAGSTTNVQIQYKDGGTLKNIDDVYTRLHYGTGAGANCNCTITVTTATPGGSTDSLKAVARANYLGEEAQVAAYFAIATPSAHASLKNALEFIGDTGGAADTYNNLSVVGNTGAISTESHENNILYKFTKNNTRMEGTTDILGSFICGTQFGLSNYFRFHAGDPVETAGCILDVSRTAIFYENQAWVRSAATKGRDYTGRPTYNYINCGEALMVLGNYSATEPFCGGDGHEVDIYTNDLVIGGPFKNHGAGYSKIQPAISSSFKSGTNSLKQVVSVETGHNIDIFNCGSGNVFYMYGNIYTYSEGNFKGDISMMGTDCIVKGEIFCSGDIYINGEANGLVLYDSSSAIHMKPGHKIYNSTGGVLADTSKTITVGGKAVKVVYEDWTTTAGDRAQRNKPKTEADVTYLHDPESFFIHSMGSGLAGQYKSRYKGTSGTDAMTLVFDESHPHLTTATSKTTFVPTKDDSKALRNGNTDLNGNGVIGEDADFFKIPETGEVPLFYITQSCVLGDYNINEDKQYYVYADGKTMNDGSKAKAPIIFIDVDRAATDICILLENGATFNCDSMKIVIKNTQKDAEGNFKKFVYFCSDSGVGTVATTGTPIEQYETKPDYASFRPSPTFRFDTKGSDTYCVTYDLYKAMKSSDPNALKNYVPEDSNVYMFIGKDGLIDISQNNFVFEGSIYAPKATVKIEKGVSMTITHFSGESKYYCVLGAVMCKNFKNDGNLSTIAYEPADENSLLPKIVKPKTLNSTGFKLSYYKPA